MGVCVCVWKEQYYVLFDVSEQLFYLVQNNMWIPFKAYFLHINIHYSSFVADTIVLYLWDYHLVM